jgi:hypothetical protein
LYNRNLLVKNHSKIHSETANPARAGFGSTVQTAFSRRSDFNPQTAILYLRRQAVGHDFTKNRN